MRDRKLLDRIIKLQAYTGAIVAELADPRKELEKENGDGNKKKVGRVSAKDISEVLARRRKVAFQST